MTFSSPPTADDLHRLLDMLYPDPPIVDILTLADFKYRYQFSRLGAGAVASLERAQRITRAVGDYDQMGLSEFHSGLIYLHECQFLGAGQYFAEARRYWEFANRQTAVCLAHFACGAAHHHAFHYDHALTRYGQVEKGLNQFPADGLVFQDGSFRAALRECLAANRQDVLRRMRAQEEGDSTAEESGRLQTTSPPIVRMGRDDANAGAPPLSIPFAPTPIPDHTNQNELLIWYQAVERRDERVFLPDIRVNTWFLVDKRLDLYDVQPGDLVIVDNGAVAGSIGLAPRPGRATGRRPQRIHLGEVKSPDQIRFMRDRRTGKITFAPSVANEVADKGKVSLGPMTETPLYVDQIVGIVIGVWGNVIVRLA
jgi:hypothetical protein